MSPSSEHETLFAAWWREHRGILHKIARSFAPSPADEADLVQDMLVQLWRSMPRYCPEQCRASTWIYRVCMNTALTWKRDATRRLERVVPVETPPESACVRPSPDASHEHAERLSALYAAIRGLPPAERSLVLLLLDGLSYREIGEITGLTETHVGVSLTRIRKKLTERLEDIRNEL